MEAECRQFLAALVLEIVEKMTFPANLNTQWLH